MASILVTGGTGTLGRRLVPQLLDRGHTVRVLSRHGGHLPEGAESFLGDVQDPARLRDAAHGIDIVIHAASSPRRKAKQVEVGGTRNVVDAVGPTGAHLIYVSIVGVDRHRLPYYRAKRAAEEIVESSSVPWTIQRATQFHDLLELFLSSPIFIKTPNLSFQVVDAGEVAARLVELADAGPSGLAPDFGGPDVRSIRDLAASRQRITGRKARLVPVPRIGFVRDFDRGLHLCPDHRDGKIGWEEWLASTV